MADVVHAVHGEVGATVGGAPPSVMRSSVRTYIGGGRVRRLAGRGLNRSVCSPGWP